MNRRLSNKWGPPHKGIQGVSLSINGGECFLSALVFVLVCGAPMGGGASQISSLAEQQTISERADRIRAFKRSCSNTWVRNFAPIPYITPIKYEEELDKRAFTIDEGPFSFSGAKSADFDGETLPPEFFWWVKAPQDSQAHYLWGDQLEFSFQPDMPGSYTVTLMVKGSNRAICDDKEHFTFAITDNTPYWGPNPQPSQAEIALALSERKEKASLEVDFPHLSAIGALEARETSLGEGVVIAILDTGVNYNHPDLRENMWQNEGEIPGNGEDDDLNGIIDDVVGYDCVHNDVFPMDDEGHGTLVAGLAAAKHYGVAPKAKIMAVKVLGRGLDTSESVACGIRYAVNEGADIINLSLFVTTFRHKDGRPYVHPLIASALRYAGTKGVIVVSAAGNGYRGRGYNIDMRPHYPASFPGDHMVGVAATMMNSDRLTGYSNYGYQTVDLGAPGGSYREHIFLKSAYFWPQNGRSIESFSGTSAGAPVSSGSIALVVSADPGRDYRDYIEALVLSGTKSEWYPLPIRSEKRLNVAHAQRILLQEPIEAASLTPETPVLPVKISR